MEKTYDIVIIGGGVVGCMIAHKLAKYKLEVALVEASADLAGGASRANSAIVHGGFDAENGTLKAKLNVLGCQAMEELAKKLDVPYKKNTSIVLAYGEKEEKTLHTLLERGKANGVCGLEIIDSKRLHELEPNISSEATAALLSPTAGIVCPYELTMATAENAAINGTDFYFDYKVDKITKTDGIFSVCSEGRTIKSKYVVNSAGIYSDEIARMIDPEFKITLIPRRGEYMILDKAEGKSVSATIFTVPNENGKGILVSPTVDGNLIVGPNAHQVEREDTSTTAVGLDEISKSARRICPDINLRAVITSFSGVRPTPDSGDFHIAPSDKDEKFLNLVGIESPGLASSPAIGDYVVGKLAEMGLELSEKSDYNPYRRDSGHKQKPFRELSDEEKSEVCKKNPAYAKMVCRCESITEGDILEAIHRPLGAKNIDMVKMRTRAGMGRCQGGFCSPRVAEILSRELQCEMNEIKKRECDSRLLFGKTK